jgi:hypothetical protein
LEYIQLLGGSADVNQTTPTPSNGRQERIASATDTYSATIPPTSSGGWVMQTVTFE